MPPSAKVLKRGPVRRSRRTLGLRAELDTQAPLPARQDRSLSQASSPPVVPLNITRSPSPVRGRLTERNLRKLEKMSSRRHKNRAPGELASTTRSSQRGGDTETQTESKTKISISTTSRRFKEQLRANHVVVNTKHVKEADDAAAMRAMLNAARASAEPSVEQYDQYRRNTRDLHYEADVAGKAYPQLCLRGERGDYSANLNHPWSEMDNHITAGISHARPDESESWPSDAYPIRVVEDLDGYVRPCESGRDGLPAYAVEFKGAGGDLQNAQLQCAYDGALMTEGSRQVHQYLARPDVDFYGQTQALTVAFDGSMARFYGHHALIDGDNQDIADQASTSSPGEETSNIYYHSYKLGAAYPQEDFEQFLKARRTIRNAQDQAYRWSTERKDALAQPRARPTFAYPAPAIAPVRSDPPPSSRRRSGRNIAANDADAAALLERQPVWGEVQTSRPRSGRRARGRGDRE